MIAIKVLTNYPGGNAAITGRGKGGVWNYFETLKVHFHEDIEYFSVGSRTSTEKAIPAIKRMLKDYVYFYLKLKNGQHELVHLNPSLNAKAVVRDGIFLIIAKFLQKKTIVFMHGWDPAFEKRIYSHFLFLFRLIYFRADAFIVLAKKFSLALQSWGYKGPIYLETTLVADALIQGRSGYTIKDSNKKPPHILFLSSIEKTKGIYEALDAFIILKEKFADLRMTVAGVGAELEKAVEYIKTRETDGITFVGWVEGAAKLEAFYHADIYLLPSYHGEGMPISVLEAMGCGLPVITRDVGGLGDFFENEKMGYMTMSKDPHVFAGYIEQLLKDPEQGRRMGEYNHNYANQRFAASQVAQRIFHIYEEVTSGPNTMEKVR